MHKRVKSNKSKSPDSKSLHDIKKDVFSKKASSEAPALSSSSSSASKLPYTSLPGDSPVRRTFRFLSYTLFALSLVPFLNYASITRERMQLKPQGVMYDIGHDGQRLYMNCSGSGSPTVILESPFSFSSDIWLRIHRQLSEITTVCSYDRAGIGFSDRARNGTSEKGEKEKKSAQQYTTESMSDDLHRLITASTSQPKPYVIVASGMSSVAARFYAQLYQTDVHHLVLIEPLSEHLQDNSLFKQWFFEELKKFQMLQVGAALGVNRISILLSALDIPLSDDFAEQPLVDKRQKHLLCNPKHISSVVDEYFFLNDTFAQINIMKTIRKLSRDIGVTIVNGDSFDKTFSKQLNLIISASQDQLKKDLPQASVVQVASSDRTMVYKRPSSVVKIIAKIVKDWKLKNPVNSVEI